MKDTRRRRRSDLFLVRVWSEDAKPGGEIEMKGADSTSREAAGPELEWHGRVQRVTDGESHPFDSRQDLLDILNSMISGPGLGRVVEE